MALHFRVAFLGFSDFERKALGSYFRLAINRNPRYEQVQMLTDADYLLADADHGPSVQLVLATERLNETVFIGSAAPAGAVAWMMRPIDALHVMRELDAMVTAAQQPEAARAPLVAPAAAPAPPPEEPSEPLVLREVEAGPPPVSLLERAAAALPEPEPALPPAPPPLPAAVAAPLPPQPPRALVVDDSEIAQRYLQARLQAWGLVVDRAASSGEALDRMRQHSHDLVFLDVELGPGSEMDGLALCQHIKRSTTALNMSVVLVSAHHSELDRVRGALAGCDAYLAKPLKGPELDRLLLRHGLTAPAKSPA
jgi:CheY-like chemotaxis protein